MSIFASAACYFIVPELKGRTASEIDQLFEEGVALRRMGHQQLAMEFEATHATSADGVEEATRAGV